MQTTYIDEAEELEAVTLDEETGKIAVCSLESLHIFQPYGQDENAVKVRAWCQSSLGLTASPVVFAGKHATTRRRQRIQNLVVGHA